jgi:hypothetical protein
VLVHELGQLITRLPRDLRVAIAASLGLSTETRQMVHFTRRIEWLVEHMHSSTRTALRRVEAAERLLAELVAEELRRRGGRTHLAPGGWYLEELKVLLRLDTLTPEAHEERHIVATQDDLVEVMAWHNVPRTREHPEPTLECEAHFGCRLVRRDHPDPHRFLFVVQVPRKLRAGERHAFGLIMRIPKGQIMRPHYIFTPECECEMFRLRVRFDPGRPLEWIRRVDGETVRMFEGGQLRGEQLALDESGELALDFPNPEMYLGYGVQWKFRDAQ